MANPSAENDKKFEAVIAAELDHATSMLIYAVEKSQATIGENLLLQLLIRRRGEIDAYVKEHEKAVIEQNRRTGVVATPRRRIVLYSIVWYRIV